MVTIIELSIAYASCYEIMVVNHPAFLNQLLCEVRGQLNVLTNFTSPSWERTLVYHWTGKIGEACNCSRHDRGKLNVLLA
jgi:hypothetical protein